MTRDAERAHVLEIRVAAFDDRRDVVRFPPRLAALVNHAALLQRADLAHAFREREPHDAASQSMRVDAAERADAVVALEHAFAQICRARPQSPLMHASVRTKRPPPPAHRALAPPAHASIVDGARVAGAFPRPSPSPGWASVATSSPSPRARKRSRALAREKEHGGRHQRVRARREGRAEQLADLALGPRRLHHDRDVAVLPAHAPRGETVRRREDGIVERIDANGIAEVEDEQAIVLAAGEPAQRE